MLHILRGVNNDLVAADAKCHKACHASYVKKKKAENQFQKEYGEGSSFHHQALKELVGEIKQDVEAGDAFEMPSLLTKYVLILKQNGVDGLSYTMQKLILRLQIVLFSIGLTTKNSGLVYNWN